MTEDSVVYAPILKWKLGEQTAVRPLSALQKGSLLPIAELAARPYDWEHKINKKSWDQHIEAVARATARYWSKKHEIAFDQTLTDRDFLEENAGTVWEFLFETLWGHGVSAVPVVSSRSSSAAINALVKVASRHGKTRWTLRWVLDAKSEDAYPSAAAIAAWFSATLALLKVAPDQVDAVLDCGYVGDWAAKSKAPTVSSWLAAVALVAPWRRRVLACGAFPENLAGVPKGTHQIPRVDWELFSLVRTSTAAKGIPFAYGDYAVSYVKPFEEDPRLLRMSANLRYTEWDRWYVLKGQNVRDHGFDQYNDLCKLLVNLPFYKGAPFSHGDQTYSDLATGVLPGPGNATHWRRDATNHHLHVVLHQLAALSGP